MSSTKKLVISGLSIALGLVLPFLTGQIPTIGNMLLPMHIPVLLCGFVCGWKYGLITGFILPILRSIMLSSPPMFPIAIAMAFELAGYGLLTGFLYERWAKSTTNIMITLVLSMLGGRAIWGMVSFVLFRMVGNMLTWEMFMAGAFINAIPGIILQLILIPSMVLALQKSKVIESV